ncbi:MAG: hypothetical protein BJ554DRAFT_6439 [Olpidium bornovanus]|uniref:Uncharacterized protein n=1 Tax=Olpidium bornovanus TaxID=278681 RepID=A0A8H8DKP1_9FUNG|nr:MAG: hypothetical protein BJ554DRAFT_6439 [Olpidium bornovanus]
MDLDYTLFDCKSTASSFVELMRPGMHELLVVNDLSSANGIKGFVNCCRPRRRRTGTTTLSYGRRRLGNRW